MLWMYSCIFRLEDDKVTPIPSKALVRWTVDDCKTFLKDRRLPTNGKRAELIDRVRANLDMEVPEPMGCHIEKVWNLLMSLCEVVTCLMEIETIATRNRNKSEKTIHRFLTRLADYDVASCADFQRTKPIWVTKCNYPCLLNLPEQMQMLGPIRKED